MKPDSAAPVPLNPDPQPADPEVRIEVQAEGEWIVTSPSGERPLHVYQLAPGDWLVSEVGRGNEGRGPDLRAALEALRQDAPAPAWFAAALAAFAELDGAAPNAS